MASRNIEVVISARDNFTGTANKVIGSLNRMDSAAGRVGKGVGQVGMGLARVAVIGATAAAGGLTLVAKKTIDWETALAGVNKTMDLTPGELQEIGTEVRKLATEIPLAATELAGLVEQAGALGIKKTDVLAFAEAAATIGVTTNVSADQAASALGGMATLLGLTGKDFERFSSALVDLGNKGASTEDQIIAIAERAAGAAATVGLTTEELLGWASAIANIKMEPEAGATSFQRFALGVLKFTRAGGDELKVLAKTAGVTGKAFAKAFEEDASGALESFIAGLSKLKKGERLDVLTALSFDDARIGRMLLGLAEAQDKTSDLSDSLDISAEAWKANTAAAEEADKRYGTTASKLALLNNQFTESALLIGEGFLPALGRVADKLKAALGDEAVRNDLRQFGKDIGDFIEGIDFDAVLSGAREFISLLKGAAGVAKTIFDAVNALPGPIKEAGVGFLALNKLSGGLIGAGAANIVGGLGQVLVRGAGSRLPGGAGRLFAQPVFVTNWPIGFGLGGGVGAGAAGAAGAGLGGAALAGGGILAASAAISAAAILGSPQFARSNQLKGQAANLTAAEIAAIKYYESDAAYQRQVVLHLGKAPTKADFESGQAKLRAAVEGAEVFGPPKPGTAGKTMFGPPAPPGMGQAFGPPGPVFEDDPRLAGIIERAEKAGRKPLDLYAAAMATLTRNVIREASFFKGAKADRTTAEEHFAIEHRDSVVPPVFEDDPRLAAIIKRSKEAGRTPTDLYASAMKTLQANIARDAERAKAAIDSVRAEAARTTAAAQRTAFAIEHKADVPIVIPPPSVEVNVSVSASNVTHKTVHIRRYGPTGGSREISEGGGHGPLI